MEWLAIESAPKDGTNILVVTWYEDIPILRTARWDKNRSSGLYGEYGWMSPGYQNIASDAISPRPGYWMELPEAPPKPDSFTAPVQVMPRHFNTDELASIRRQLAGKA